MSTRARARLVGAAVVTFVAASISFADGLLGPADVSVHPAVREGSLALFPITLVGRRAPPGDFILLDEGLTAGTVVITETGSPASDAEAPPEPLLLDTEQRIEVQQEAQIQQVEQIQQRSGRGEQVNTLSVRNGADRPLLLVAGEMIRGAKQDRIIAHDVVVEPGGSIQDLDVFCVESGRWTYESEQFCSAKAVSGAGVRQAAQLGKDQRAVWDKVAEYNAAVGATSETDSLNAAYDKPEIREAMAASQNLLRAELAGIPDLCGLIAAIGGRIVVADVFATPELFRRLEAKLLAAHLMDALSAPPTDAPPPTLEEVRRYLARALAAPSVVDWKGGDLEVSRIEGEGASGARSRWRGQDLHVVSY